MIAVATAFRDLAETHENAISTELDIYLVLIDDLSNQRIKVLICSRGRLVYCILYVCNSRKVQVLLAGKPRISSSSAPGRYPRYSTTLVDNPQDLFCFMSEEDDTRLFSPDVI